MTPQPIPLHPRDEGEAATRELRRAAESRLAARDARLAPSEAETLRHALATLESLDRQYGASAPLPVEGAQDVAASAIEALHRLGEPRLVIGAALWALRHGVEILAVEPVVNALAERSNAARDQRELAAAASLMQAVIGNVRDRLGADLERSNPERPWRILHANLAITAIRSEEPALIDAAFDALDQALPDERATFYAEALALALAPGIADAVRSRIADRHRRWAAPEGGCVS